MKKSAKLNEQMRVLQFKYKNDPEKLNQEMMKLYKEENMSFVLTGGGSQLYPLYCNLFY